MKDITLYSFNYAEILALITSISCIKWLIKTPYLFFLPYMLMTVLAACLGSYLEHKGMFATNNQVFNVTTVIEFLFFYYLFFSAIKKPFFKKAILVLSSLCLFCVMVNLIFFQGLYQFNSYSLLVGTVTTIILLFLYFYDAFENSEPINLLREPMFWISIGIFLFYLGDFTFNLMYPFLQRNNLKREQHLFKLINNNLIVFEHLCFSVAIIINSINKQPARIKISPQT